MRARRSNIAACRPIRRTRHLDEHPGKPLGNPGLTGDHTIMNNADLADRIADSHGITKTDAKKLVDTVFSSIAAAAAKGEEVSLNGFGKFKVKQTAAREGRNPATGKTIQIAASKKLAFTPAKAVKDKLNG
jgi:DNA-binding protein HU-beta